MALSFFLSQLKYAEHLKKKINMEYQYHKDGTLPKTSDYIFVYGSNIAGRHGKGAALIAKEKFGAEYGVGIGLKGRSYAIPTKDKYLNTLPIPEISKYIEQFKEFTYSRPDLKFWVTSVGCGLAGYKAYDIAPLFRKSNFNCNFPSHWKQYLI